MRKSLIYKVAACVILLEMLLNVGAPLVALALTSGPAQPEFSDFEPLGTTGMVNEFTGQFTYNLPVLEVPGPNGSSYPLTLAYHSNTGAEEDASWVECGWSLNPGAIQRAVRGVPDDWKGVEIIEINQQPDVETWVIGTVSTLQAMSTDLFTYEQANRYSTMTGFSSTSGFSISLGGFVSLSWRSQNGVTRFTANPNWMNILQWAGSTLTALAATEKVEEQSAPTTEAQKLAEDQVPASNPPTPSEDPTLKNETSTAQMDGMMYSSVANYIGRALGNFGVPSTTSNTNTNSYHVNFAVTGDVIPAPIVVGINYGIRGSLTIHSVGNQNKSAYGMLYANKLGSFSSSRRTADVTRERENDYQGRDLFLSPTYNMYDAFMMSAHGVSGSARLIHNALGINGPTTATGDGTTFSIGLEASAGPAKVAGGKTLAIGFNSSETSKLSTSETPYSSFGPVGDQNAQGRNPFNNRSDVFMRISGDLADSVRYSDSFVEERPRIDVFGDPIYPQSVSRLLNRSQAGQTRPRSSSHVSFKTNAELAVGAGGIMLSGRSTLQSISPRSNGVHTPYLDRTETAIKDQIGEVSVVNPAGMTYVYGLPVYSREERSYMYSGEHVRHRSYGGSNRFVSGAFDKWSPRTETYKKTPYASALLLTDIYTPDYVDMGASGPSTDDLGGYVALRYRRAAGTTLKSAPVQKDWYRWRTPYMGYSYAAERVSQPYMDRAAVSMGQKELYYVGSIDTKTHVAFFVTNRTNQSITVGGKEFLIKGSQKERWDGYEAINFGESDQLRLTEENMMSRHPMVDSNLATSIDPSSASIGIGKWLGRVKRPKEVTEDWVKKNTRKNKSEYLEKIILIAKDSTSAFREVVQTVNFEYSYELQARPADWSIWFEEWDPYEEVKRTIPEPLWDSVYYCYGTLNSAYRFTTDSVREKHSGKMVNMEQYGKLTLKRVWTEYGDVKGAAISPYVFHYTYPLDGVDGFAWSDAVSNDDVWIGPRNFSENYTTSTGNGVSVKRRNQLRQNPAYDVVNIDPWGSYTHTGGDQGNKWRQHIRQSVAPGSGSGGGGYDPAAWQLKMITLPSGAQIHIQYESNTYSFVQDRQAMALVPLSNATINEEGIVFCTLDIATELPGRPAKDVYHALLRSLEKDDRLFFRFLYPVANCNSTRNQDYVPRTSEFVSGFAPVSSSDISFNETTGQITIRFNSEPTPGELLREYLFNRDGSFPKCSMRSQVEPPEPPTAGSQNSRSSWDQLSSAGPSIADRITDVNTLTANGGPVPYYKMSAVRIPCLWKYGGGVRVKRIFIHDIGLENGVGGLYGTEYDYSMTENSALMSSGVATNEPAAIREENPLFRFIPGKEAASWYQKITAGEEIDQYAGPIGGDALPPPSIGYSRVMTRSIANVPTSPGFTVSQYYTARDHPVRVHNTELIKHTLFLPLVMTGITNIQSDFATATQGFSIHTNGMHGRVRSVTKYSGTPDGQNSIVESITYDYFAPEEPKPILYRDEYGYFKVRLANVGVEEDISIDSRQYKTASFNGSVPFDIGLFGLVAPFAHIGIPSANYSDARVDLSTITKVFTHPCYLKSTTVQRRSIVTRVENLAFDALTGDPRIVKTTDEYADMPLSTGINSGTRLEYSIPAYEYYKGMGATSENDGLIFGAADNQAVSATTNSTGTSIALTLGTAGMQALKLMKGDVVYIVSKSATTHTAGRFYRVETAGSTTATLVSGHSTTSPLLTGFVNENVEVVVVRPARTNQLHEVAFTFTRHNEALDYSNPIPSSISNVVNASATVYSDEIEQYPLLSVPSGKNIWDVGQRGRWKPWKAFVYKAPTTGVFSAGSTHPAVIGRTETPMSAFNFETLSSNATQWVLMTTTTKISPQGQPVEELNALGVPSTVVYSHAQSVPAIIAQNADAGSVVFQSYEEDVAASNMPHTGKSSKALNTSGSTGLVTLTTTARTMSQGILIRAWVKARSNNLSATFSLNGVSSTAVIRPQVDGWHLMEAKFTSNQMSGCTVGSTYELGVTVSGASGTSYIDDVRSQPLYAASTCYVYDPSTLRLVAQLDDQHFAVIYKYDQEGRLTRKDRETVRGRMPFHEVHYNRPTVAFGADNSLMMTKNSGYRNPGASLSIPYVPNGVGPSVSPSKMGGSFDMLQLKINPSRLQYKVLGSDSGEIRTDSTSNASPRGGRR
ncbi:MAG: hypothetical protein IPH49_14380 [Ignavibacteria bacterium]|nr:hypothetical protein [Ignavibacteria bacterium]